MFSALYAEIDLGGHEVNKMVVHRVADVFMARTNDDGPINTSLVLQQYFM
jgi:hypothetical protein